MFTAKQSSQRKNKFLVVGVSAPARMIVGLANGLPGGQNLNPCFYIASAVDELLSK